MAYNDYLKAMKAGEKSFGFSSKKKATLPVLEQLVPDVGNLPQINLGITEIPLELIAGTYTQGRTNAFSKNFMPILGPETEFAAKWSELYDSLQRNGQQVPVKAYEYLNEFYILEGNKRVSVQKFMGAVAVEGEVIRILPKRNEKDPKIRLYYEYLNFYNLTKINYILMDNEGSYNALYKFIHPYDDGPITDDEALEVKYLFCMFKRCYEEKGGDKLKAKFGEQFLRYIKIFGYDDVRNHNSTIFKNNMSELWSELVTFSEDKTVSLLTDPVKESKFKSIIKKLNVSIGNQPLKVAFLYYKSPEESGWTEGHELSRTRVQEHFEGRVDTEYFVTHDASDYSTLDKIVKDGYKLIFTTSPVLSSISLKCAVLNPDIIILNCSLNNAYKHLRSYYLRFYEIKFLMGMLASAYSETNKIGYIADYPIYGMPASVNAFALGAYMLNPRIQIFLEWSTQKNSDPVQAFNDRGVDIISNKDITAKNSSDDCGLYGLYEGEKFKLAHPVWKWEKLYIEVIDSILFGDWKNDDLSNNEVLNYFWGISSGAVDIKLDSGVEPITAKLISIMKHQIKRDKFDTFKQEFYKFRTNNTRSVVTKQDIIELEDLHMCIKGGFPELNDLEPECRELISQLGISKYRFKKGIII